MAPIVVAARSQIANLLRGGDRFHRQFEVHRATTISNFTLGGRSTLALTAAVANLSIALLASCPRPRKPPCPPPILIRRP